MVPVGDIINFLHIMERIEEGEIRLRDKNRNLYERFGDTKALKDLIIAFSKYGAWKDKPVITEDMFSSTSQMHFILDSIKVHKEIIHHNWLDFTISGNIYYTFSEIPLKVNLKASARVSIRFFFGSFLER
jgi:hypothetical protein